MIQLAADYDQPASGKQVWEEIIRVGYAAEIHSSPDFTGQEECRNMDQVDGKGTSAQPGKHRL